MIQTIDINRQTRLGELVTFSPPLLHVSMNFIHIAKENSVLFKRYEKEGGLNDPEAKRDVMTWVVVS